ncbi:hypothetical protein [Pendulispora albinea]|uniref:Uncharacterized protein n=1 Tax=Pendulispora albinea TaxID=2741071 RepID=A0ABZ2LZL4_9BACT
MKRSIWLTISMLFLFALLAACHDRKPAEGPAERAGKKVDNAAQETKGAAKDVKDDIKKRTDDK